MCQSNCARSCPAGGTSPGTTPAGPSPTVWRQQGYRHSHLRCDLSNQLKAPDHTNEGQAITKNNPVAMPQLKAEPRWPALFSSTAVLLWAGPLAAAVDSCFSCCLAEVAEVGSLKQKRSGRPQPRTTGGPPASLHTLCVIPFFLSSFSSFMQPDLHAT